MLGKNFDVVFGVFHQKDASVFDFVDMGHWSAGCFFNPFDEVLDIVEAEVVLFAAFFPFGDACVEEAHDVVEVWFSAVEVENDDGVCEPSFEAVVDEAEFSEESVYHLFGFDTLFSEAEVVENCCRFSPINVGPEYLHISYHMAGVFSKIGLGRRG